MVPENQSNLLKAFYRNRNEHFFPATTPEVSEARISCLPSVHSSALVCHLISQQKHNSHT